MQLNSSAAQKRVDAEHSLWPPWLLRSNRLWRGSPETLAPVKSTSMSLVSFAAGLQVANSRSVFLGLNLVSAAWSGKAQAGDVGAGSRACAHSLQGCVSLGPGALALRLGKMALILLTRPK